MPHDVVDLGNLRSPRQRVWQGRALGPVEEVRMFFEGKGPLPEAFDALRRRLAQAGLPHVFIGAVAVNAHGYRRSTEDIDLCMAAEDLERFRREFVGPVYQSVAGRTRKFFDPATQVTFDVLVAGRIAGDARKQRDIRFPQPAEAELIEGVPVPPLARLIELKLVTRRFHDWADVVHLIRIHRLDERFADRLHPLVRMAYLECLDQCREEDRYNPEVDDAPPAGS